MKGNCAVCSEAIEFENEFEGTETQCPICHRPTILRRAPEPVPAWRAIARPRYIVPGVIIALLAWLWIAQPNLFFSTVETFGMFFPSIAIIAAVLAAIFLIVLWIVFPWMVLAKMNQVIAELKKLNQPQ